MTVFVFVRHGQATHNLSKAYWDVRERDAALTATGVRQAWDLRLKRLAVECDAVWCSPLQRCRQTALFMLGEIAWRPMEWIYLDDRLMEPQGEAIVNRRAELSELRSLDVLPPSWNLDHVGAVNPFDILLENSSVGKEGHGGFDRRVRTWTGEMVRRYPTGRLLVVTHHDWIASWFRQFEGRHVSLGNCEWIVGRRRG